MVGSQFNHCFLSLEDLRLPLLLNGVGNTQAVVNLRELLVGCKECDDAKRKVVQADIVRRFRSQSLRGHVGQGARAGCEIGELLRVKVEEPRHPQVRYLGAHVGREENVAGREVAVHYGRVPGVQVQQTVRDVFEDVQSDGERHERVGQQTLLQVHVQVLQNEGEVARDRPVVHAEELDDVGVTDATEKEALGTEALLYRCSSSAGGARHGYLAVGEDVVKTLGDARHAVDAHLVHGAEAARAPPLPVLQPLQLPDHVARQLLVHPPSTVSIYGETGRRFDRCLKFMASMFRSAPCHLSRPEFKGQLLVTQ